MSDGNDEASQLKPGYYVLQTDGSMKSSGHRGKDDPPGEAAIGVVLKSPSDTVVETVSRAIGPASNHLAEYHALVEGLELALRRAIKHIRVYMDSAFIVDQMNGLAKVNEPDLQNVHAKATSLFEQFPDRRIS